MENFYDYIEKGGIIFSILVIFSAIGVTLILYKFFELNFFNDFNVRNFEKFLINSKTIDEFKLLIDQENDSEKKKFLINIIQIIEKKGTVTNKEQAIEIFIHEKFTRAQKFLPSLEIIAQVSPLIGLLGTVIGMIDSFNELELGGSLVDPSVLAGGIWTALLTTAMGLIVAIPALVSYYFFEKKLTNSMQYAYNFSTKLISLSSKIIND